jgi:ATP-dependent DNA ligase
MRCPGLCPMSPNWDGYRCVAIHDDTGVALWSRQGKELTGYSVGVKRRRADLWPSESAVISARQVSLTSLGMPTSFSTTRTASRRGRTTGAPAGNSTFIP